MPTDTPQPELPSPPTWFKELMGQFSLMSLEQEIFVIYCNIPNSCPWRKSWNSRGVTLADLLDVAFGHAVQHAASMHKNEELLREIFKS